MLLICFDVLLLLLVVVVVLFFFVIFRAVHPHLAWKCPLCTSHGYIYLNLCSFSTVCCCISLRFPPMCCAWVWVSAAPSNFSLDAVGVFLLPLFCLSLLQPDWVMKVISCTDFRRFFFDSICFKLYRATKFG